MIFNNTPDDHVISDQLLAEALSELDWTKTSMNDHADNILQANYSWR